MVRRSYLIFLFLSIICLNAYGQEDSYDLDLYPDLWYNDADGIRLGLRFLGNMEGRFEDGPHRLDAGIWLASKWPDAPVSYYISFLEPLPGMNVLGNEGSVEVVSSIREGYSMHSLRVHKRWQPGFNEYDHTKVTFYYSQEKLTDLQYRPFAQLWQQEWKSIIGLNLHFSRQPDAGDTRVDVNLLQNINPSPGAFTMAQVSARQQLRFTSYSELRFRFFGGYTSSGVAPEYSFIGSVSSPQFWLNEGVSRSAGTIPQPLLEQGFIQFAGGANMRGYLNRDMDELAAGGSPVFQSLSAFNAEFRFTNGLDKMIDNLSVVGDLVDLRSYAFADVAYVIQEGTPVRTVHGPIDKLFADAGLGVELSVNIPDYLGRNRGIFLRYDVPLWLSDPVPGENAFKYRHLIGIGATISL